MPSNRACHRAGRLGLLVPSLDQPRFAGPACGCPILFLTKLSNVVRLLCYQTKIKSPPFRRAFYFGWETRIR